MKKYFLYDLCIASDIELMLFDNICRLPDNTPCEVTVHMNDYIPEELEKLNANYTIVSEYSLKRCWFISNIGYIVVENGTSINIYPKGNPPEKEIASYILGWGMTFLFYQRNTFGIHCAGLSDGRQAFLICGDSGAGKSTTSLKLLSKGYRYLNDDVAFLSETDGFLLHPGFPIQKVCRDVAENIIDKSRLVYIDRDKDKFAYSNPESFDNMSRPVSFMFCIEKDETILKTEHFELCGLDKINALLDNFLMSSHFRRNGTPNAVMTMVLKLAGKVKIVKIARPDKGDTVEEVCSIIESYLI